MPGVAVADMDDIEMESFVACASHPDFLRVELARPDFEFVRTVFARVGVARELLRQQEIVERRYRPVVQVRRGGPGSVQGACFVGTKRRERISGRVRVVVAFLDGWLDAVAEKGVAEIVEPLESADHEVA